VQHDTISIHPPQHNTHPVFTTLLTIFALARRLNGRLAGGLGGRPGDLDGRCGALTLKEMWRLGERQGKRGMEGCGCMRISALHLNVRGGGLLISILLAILLGVIGALDNSF
jgi:hypothetical protein